MEKKIKMKKEKTFTESCDVELIIKGKYSTGNLWEEDLGQMNKDIIWDYISNNICDFYEDAKIIISNEKIEEE